MPDNPSATLLLTRSRPQSLKFAADLARFHGCAPVTVVAPLLEIVPIAHKTPPDAKTLLFTSANGVRSFSDAAPDQARPDPTRLAYCVGRQTCAAARDAGFRTIDVDGTAETLLARVVAERPQELIVHVHGVHVTSDLVAELRRAGIRAQSLCTYDQQARPLSDEAKSLLASGCPVIAPVFSPRSAKLLSQACDGRCPDALTVIAISTKTAAALPESWSPKTLIAAQPNGEAMLKSTARQLCL